MSRRDAVLAILAAIVILLLRGCGSRPEVREGIDPCPDPDRPTLAEDGSCVKSNYRVAR